MKNGDGGNIRLTNSLRTFSVRGGAAARDFFLRLAVVPSRNTLILLAIFLIWAVLVGLGIWRHEFWRDEARALSLALEAKSLWSVPATVQGEGHPAMWYLLLWGAYGVLHVKAVLPIMAAAVAAMAIAVFLWRAPFPWWYKALFVFSGAPLYEYSISARNYGLSMLFMFLFAAAYASQRRSPLLLGAILFLLAQTSVQAALLIPFLWLIWFFDWYMERQSGQPPRLLPAILGTALVLTGIAAAVLTVYPPAHGGVVEHTVGKMSLADATELSLTYSGVHFFRTANLPPSLMTLFLYAAIAGLVSFAPAFLAALGGLWVTSMFYFLVYPATGFRHEAVFLVFLTVLYWLKFSNEKKQQPNAAPRPAARFSARLRFVFPLLLAINCVVGFKAYYADLRQDLSSSKDIGKLLDSSDTLRSAIVMAEPEHIGEAVAYYADNDMYLVREGKFGRFTTWGTNSTAELSLGTVLDKSETLKVQTGKPVVILMQHVLTDADADKTFGAGGYGWSFHYSADELRDFRAATKKIATYRQALTDENVDVYLLE